MAKAFAMRLMHLGLPVFVIGETTTPAVTRHRHPGRGLRVRHHRRHGPGRAAGRPRWARRSGPSPPTPRRRSGAAATGQLVIPAATKYRRADEAPTIQPLSSLFDQATHIALDVVCLIIAGARGVDNTEAVRQHANTE